MKNVGIYFILVARELVWDSYWAIVTSISSTMKTESDSTSQFFTTLARWVEGSRGNGMCVGEIWIGIFQFLQELCIFALQISCIIQ